MGLFCASLHFRGTDEAALRSTLEQRALTQFRIAPSKGSWTSVYEERCSQQDEDWIRELTGELAREVHAPAVAFMVHDSDIACYWLFDNDEQLDEYNSFPDYFDAGGGKPAGPRGGRPEALIDYCKPGVTLEELARILTEEATFAESVIEQLAEALGIDPERALGDYRYEDDGPSDFGGFGDDDDDNDGPGNDDNFPGGSRSTLKALTGRLAQMFAAQPHAAADSQASALVQAAASGDTDGIARLLSEGAAVDAEAPAPLPTGQPLAGLGQFFPAGLPQVAMTPLLTAVSHGQARAVEVLLDGGADPNHGHPLFGTPIHAAAGNGDVSVLKLLIDRGGDVNGRNAHGQTALAVLAASRLTLERLAQAQDVIKSLGHGVPPLIDQLSKAGLPTDGWNRCEELLKAHGAR
jgi:hypothetical protein